MSAPVEEFLTEIICLHSLAPWSWKRQQQNVEIRYSTNNDRITCIRCEIMNSPLKILTFVIVCWRIPTDSAVATQIIAKIPLRST